MRRLDIRYVAGLVDGEGCISIHINKAALQANKKARIVFQLSISNTNLPILQAIKRQFGGAIHAHKSIKRLRPEHKLGYNWTISERAACGFVSRILPHLHIKKRQALLALKLLRLKNKYLERKRKGGVSIGCPLTKQEYSQRVKIAKQCHLLNRRGQ